MLISFEGIEGSGKTTLIASLADDLRSSGADVLVTREPGGTALGDALRHIFVDPAFRIDPLAEVFLINASRAQHVSELIAPSLKRGATVLCDRFFDATVAYQGYGRGLDVELLVRLCLAATQSFAPDLTILLDIPPEVSAERVRLRGGVDRLEREDVAFHTRVRDGYINLARRFPRFAILDGMLAPADLHDAAMALIAQRRHRAAG